MGRKARAKREPRNEPHPAPPVRSAPNWALLALSIVGILLAAYLSYTEWVGRSLRGCSAGSSCEIVLLSPWATLLGVPTAVWGMVAYLTLAASAFIPGVERHWRTSWALAFFGVVYSLYLTTVSLTILHAACLYCLTSLLLMTVIFALVTSQRPPFLEAFSWPRWIGRFAAIATPILIGLHLNYIGVIGAPPAVEDPAMRALAIHLADSGARMYGASWCPHCQEQKALFGPSARRLPYIECSTGAQGSPQTEVCRDAKIKIYPTWIINGTRTEEVMTPQQLAAAATFQLPARAQE